MNAPNTIKREKLFTVVIDRDDVQDFIKNADRNELIALHNYINMEQKRRSKSARAKG